MIANGRDWTAFSSDVGIAKAATTEVRSFSNGEKARWFDSAVVGSGHVQLLACPAGSGPGLPVSAGVLTFDLEVALRPDTTPAITA